MASGSRQQQGRDSLPRQVMIGLCLLPGLLHPALFSTAHSASPFHSQKKNFIIQHTLQLHPPRQTATMAPAAADHALAKITLLPLKHNKIHLTLQLRPPRQTATMAPAAADHVLAKKNYTPAPKTLQN